MGNKGRAVRSPRTGSLLGCVALHFDPARGFVPRDLSAAARAEDGAIWLAADERAALEVLTPDSKLAHCFSQHRCHPLSAALGIAEDAEVDIEGFAMEPEASALWFIGSHSAKRKKPKGKGHRADLERLARVETEPARFILARTAIENGAPKLEPGRGLWQFDREGGGALLELLADDEHLAPFLPTKSRAHPPIPGKDNGFDVEGLGFFDGRLLIGLRGPVLRGWAFVLDIELIADAAGSLVPSGRGERPYRKHALDLDGLGVRELIVEGDDVLVLAGPTMALDGAHRLFRWSGGPRAKGDSVVAQEEGVLEPLFDLPWGPGTDRAEGTARFSWFEEDDSILVVYDSPGPRRMLGEGAVLADVFAI
jgi:hypothetical protein